MESNTVYSLSIGRMLALLVHYFAGYLYVYRIIATKITLALEPGATILLPWVQLLIYVFTAGVAMLLAWPAIRDSWVRFRRRTEANLKMSAYLVIIFIDWTFDADWKQCQSGGDSQCQYGSAADDNIVNLCICTDHRRNGVSSRCILLPAKQAWILGRCNHQQHPVWIHSYRGFSSGRKSDGCQLSACICRNRNGSGLRI